jgi:hypothetical protein
MWPNLVPGDILKAEDVQATEIRPGMIAVLSRADEGITIVHRILRVCRTEQEIVVETGGDRSGPDEAEWHFSFSDEIKRVTAVLRRGSYCRISCFSVPTVLSPLPVVKLHCRIVRKLFW